MIENFYFQDSQIVNFCSNNQNTKYSIEIIKKSILVKDVVKDLLARDFGGITRQTWGDPGKLVDVWLDLADILLVARKGKAIHGFAIGNFFHDDAVLLVATMTLPEDQRNGLATFMNKRIIRQAYIKKLLKGNFFRPLYFVFRTPNPRLYEMLHKKVNIVPSLNRKPNSTEFALFRDVVRNFSPKNEVDESKLIIKGAYNEYPELVYTESQIPWSDNEKINEFMESQLKLVAGEGNTMVIIGRV